jgi:hypothetical protein
MTLANVSHEAPHETLPWLRRVAPGGKVSTWSKRENRKNAMRWIYETYREKTAAEDIAPRFRVRDVTDLTESHLIQKEILGKSFRGLLTYASFPELMLEAFPDEFSTRFNSMVEPVMFRQSGHWNRIVDRIRIVHGICDEIITRGRPLYRAHKRDFTDSPFGWNYSNLLVKMQELYGLRSHWVALAEAFVLSPENHHYFRLNNEGHNHITYFSLTSEYVDDVNRKSLIRLTSEVPDSTSRGILLRGAELFNTSLHYR